MSEKRNTLAYYQAVFKETATSMKTKIGQPQPTWAEADKLGKEYAAKNKTAGSVTIAVVRVPRPPKQAESRRFSGNREQAQAKE